MDALKRIQFLEDRLHRLSEIGMALSTEKDTDRLFEMILEEAKNITKLMGGPFIQLMKMATLHLKFLEMIL